mgnify:CR=1 FL=1
MNTLEYLKVFFVCTVLMFVFPMAGIATDNVLTRLDRCLDSSSLYDAAKANEIAELNRKAISATNDRERFMMYLRLYKAYESYKYDSASVYADKAYSLACKINSYDFIVESVCAKVFCLLSAGMYKEAFDELNVVDIAKASLPCRYKYYFVKWRLLADAADYCHTEPYYSKYIREAHSLADSLLSVNGNTLMVPYIKGMQLMKEGKYDKSIDFFLQTLKDKRLGMHNRAICASCVGWMYRNLGDKKRGLDYLAESAMCDIKSSTKETTALRQVGELLYADGDYNHAITYVQKALDDANFYNARQRKLEIGSILPIIQEVRYKDMAWQRNIMLLCAILACALLVVLAAGTVIIRKQMKKLQQPKDTIEEHNRQLAVANGQLSEANKIKIEYIDKLFYVSSEHFCSMEKLYRTIDRKIAARQYDDLRRSLSEKTIVEYRKNMYEDFDEVFLQLFPDFVEKYNRLFNDPEKKDDNDGKTLTNEMRIFALIRLGITDSERIAKFLNYSVNTINTYKSRVKNKSNVNNDIFEQKIMEI